MADPEADTPIKVVEANNKVDVRSPEFIMALIVLALFGAAYFLHATESMQGALISAFSMAVGYYLSTQRKKPNGE